MAEGVGDFLTIDFRTFQELFYRTIKSRNIINNQRRKYNLQQEQNLKTIFLTYA
jgi:hypothetical protein